MIQDRNMCSEHSEHKQRISCVEHKCSKLDNRLWFILIVLMGNLAGIIGILVSINLH